jgi:hypothetical protein
VLYPGCLLPLIQYDPYLNPDVHTRRTSRPLRMHIRGWLFRREPVTVSHVTIDCAEVLVLGFTRVRDCRARSQTLGFGWKNYPRSAKIGTSCEMQLWATRSLGHASAGQK